jgi:hypothetical protein
VAGPRERAAWANADDATRDGAYAIALSVMEAELGLVSVSRAETLTGADYYLAESVSGEDEDNLERAYRLEVSGVCKGDRSSIHQLLANKVDQARRGDSTLPAYACVVGFLSLYVVIQIVEVHDEQS